MPPRTTSLVIVLIASVLTLAALALAGPGEASPSPATPADASTSAAVTSDGPAPVPMAAPTPPSAGEVRIAEVMPDPACVPDADGEWVELLNVTERPIDLQGVRIGARFDRSAPLAEAPLTVPPGGRLLVGRSEAGGAAGAPIDVLVPRLVLANRDGRVALFHGAAVIDSVEYGESAGIPVAKGRSLVLDPATLGAPGGARWCLSPGRDHGPCGDLGSPGRSSQPCSRKGKTARKR